MLSYFSVSTCFFSKLIWHTSSKCTVSVPSAYLNKPFSSYREQGTRKSGAKGQSHWSQSVLSTGCFFLSLGRCHNFHVVLPLNKYENTQITLKYVLSLHLQLRKNITAAWLIQTKIPKNRCVQDTYRLIYQSSSKNNSLFTSQPCKW